MNHICPEDTCCSFKTFLCAHLGISATPLRQEMKHTWERCEDQWALVGCGHWGAGCGIVQYKCHHSWKCSTSSLAVHKVSVHSAAICVYLTAHEEETISFMLRSLLTAAAVWLEALRTIIRRTKKLIITPHHNSMLTLEGAELITQERQDRCMWSSAE